MSDRSSKKRKRAKGGFTIIELMLVVVILGVLAAVVIPRFTGLIGRGEEQAASTEHEIVQTAMVAAMVGAIPAVDTVAPLATAATLGPATTDPVECPIGPYLQTDTGWTYTWIADGTVTQIPN